MSEALTFPAQPDPHLLTGWFEAEALAVISAAESWEQLDEYETKLHVMAKIIESQDRDSVDLIKALRLVEKRRGDLLGNPGPGRPADNRPRADDFGIPHATANRYRTIAKHWDDVVWPHLVAAKQKAEVSQSRILKLIRRHELETEIRPEACTVADLQTLAELGMRFGTLYADPPWQYGNQATRAATGNHYEGMTPEQVCDLFDFTRISADTAHLHLWTTNAFLEAAFSVLRAWGFEYKSCFVWTKPKMGIGNYWRVSHEFLLLGVRGSCPFADKGLMSWATLARGKHSAKPEGVRKMIEAASPGPRLELFARHTSPGWVTWGDEIEKTLFDEHVLELMA